MQARSTFSKFNKFNIDIGEGSGSTSGLLEDDVMFASFFHLMMKSDIRRASAQGRFVSDKDRQSWSQSPRRNEIRQNVQSICAGVSSVRV